MNTAKIITTVGTSVFENYLKDKTVAEKDKRDFRVDYNYIKDESPPFSKYNANKEMLEELEEHIVPWYKNAPNASAEIKSILKIKEETEGEVEIYLIATDTVLSVKAAELVKEWLVKKGILVNKKISIIECLRIQDANAFINNGIQNLIVEILNIHESDNQENSILNISGGFKAMIPVLTIVGQLYDMPLFYIYENSDTPIEIQRLPISFDWDVIESYTDYLAQPNKIEDEDIQENMINLHLIRDNTGTIELTVVGQLLKKFLLRQPPHFSTTFGYFVEYKIKECFDEKFGCQNVLHGYKSKTNSFSGDLDLIVLNNDQMETIEVKPLDLLNNEGRLSHFISSLSKRTKIAEKELAKTANKLCLMVYRFKQPNDPPIYKLSAEQKNIILRIEQQVKADFPEANFLVKCFYVKPNSIKKGERILHQKFLKSSLKYNQIQTIFPTK